MINWGAVAVIMVFAILWAEVLPRPWSYVASGATGLVVSLLGGNVWKRGKR